jgi:GAF domain-containing protein
MDKHDMILNGVSNISGIDCAALFFLRDCDGSLELVAQRGLSTTFVHENKHLGADSADAVKVREGCLWMSDYESLIKENSNDHMLMEGMRAILVVPVIRDNRILGSLHVASRAEFVLTPQTVAAVKAFASRLGERMGVV